MIMWLVWFGMVWFGMVWYGLVVWLKTADFQLRKVYWWMGRWVTFDYSVSPGPYFWLWNFNFDFVLDWNIVLDLDLDLTVTWTWSLTIFLLLKAENSWPHLWYILLHNPVPLWLCNILLNYVNCIYHVYFKGCKLLTINLLLQIMSKTVNGDTFLLLDPE